MATRIVRFGPVGIPLTTAASVGVVGGIRGAKALFVEVYGASAGNVVTITAKGSADAAGAADAVGNGAVVTVTGSAVACNGATEGLGGNYALTPPATPGVFQVDYVNILAACATGAMTGAYIVVWAHY